MGIVDEILKELRKAWPMTIVHQYEQGLRYTNGKCELIQKRLSRKTLESLIEREDKIKNLVLNAPCPALAKLYWASPLAGFASLPVVSRLLSGYVPKLPEGYKRSFWTGIPYNADKTEQENKKAIGETSKQGILDYVRKAIKHLAWLSPVYQPRLPENWQRGLFGQHYLGIGYPMHKKRFKPRIFRSGYYFFIPYFQKIETDFTQQRNYNLGHVTFQTKEKDSKDSRTLAVSCNLKCELEDFFLAYNKVHDYQKSLQDECLAKIFKHCAGKSFQEMTDEKTIKQIQAQIKDEMENVGKKWGFLIYAVLFTDIQQAGSQGGFTRIWHSGDLPINPIYTANSEI